MLGEMAPAEVVKDDANGARTTKAQRITTLDQAGDAALERPKLL
jgi:hypothetical protein